MKRKVISFERKVFGIDLDKIMCGVTEETHNKSISKAGIIIGCSFMVIGWVLMAGGVFIVVAQVGLWMYSGKWIALPSLIILGVVPYDSFHLWLYSPQSWIGVQNIIVWIGNLVPLSFAIFIIGYLLCRGLENYGKELDRRTRS